jgi:hypothetical protein
MGTEFIAADPAILGIGDLVLRDKERIQPRAGRLDLLLQDVEAKRRYEVEIQLGPTDEAHIIRTIEYWDIERKRYPRYVHCAVLIAEDITSRFLNVVALFNGTIPLIAMQTQALKVGDHLTLIFTKVMDELSRGLVDEDEDPEAAPTDRADRPAPRRSGRDGLERDFGRFDGLDNAGRAHEKRCGAYGAAQCRRLRSSQGGAACDHGGSR